MKNLAGCKEVYAVTKIKIIYNPLSYAELEKEVNEFINRDDVGQIHSVQFNDHAVLIMYDEYDPLNPYTY